MREEVFSIYLDVLVLRVDDLSELATIHLLLEHPHLDLGLEPLGEPGGVGANKPGDGRAPVTAPDDANLLGRHHLCCCSGQSVVAKVLIIVECLGVVVVGAVDCPRCCC